MPLGRAMAALALVMLAGAALRFHQLGELSLWLDEAATWGFANVPLADLWGDRYLHEPNPPLYYTLQRLWLVFGDSEAAMRSLPAMLGVLTLPLAYGIGAIAGDRRVGLMAAALTATAVTHVEYSQEARTYILLLGAAALALLGQMELLRDPAAAARPTPRALLAWGAYVAGNVIALFSHNTAVFLPLLTGLAALVCWWWQTRWNWRLLGFWALSGAVVLLLWGWRLPVLLQQSETLSHVWHMRFPSLEKVVTELARAYGQQYAPARPAPDLLYFAAAGAGVWRWRREPQKLVPLLMVIVGLPIATLLMSLKIPMWVTRTLLWPMPALIVLAAAGVTLPRRRAVRWSLAGLLVAIQCLGLIAYYDTHTKREPWREAVAAILARAEPGDTIVAEPSYVRYPLHYYLRDAEDPPALLGLFFNRGDLGDRPPGPSVTLLRHPVLQEGEEFVPWDAIRPAGRIWLLGRGPDRGDRRQRLLQPTHLKADQWTSENVEVTLYIPREPTG